MALYRLEKDGRELRIHENADELRSNLAEYIADLSEASIKERGTFAVALSGGSLITLMGYVIKFALSLMFSGDLLLSLNNFELLAVSRKLCEAPYIKTIDWAKWHIFWADERVVAKSHADSNYKLAKDGLFAKVPVIYSHVHSINDTVSAERAAEDYEFVIRQLVRTRVINVSEINDCPKFDLVLLGMGPDGHVASLFPNHSVLSEKLQWVTFITDSPKPPPERITFTFPVINSASNVAVVVTGGGKAEAAHLAIDDIGPDRPKLPARMVQPTQGKLVWFLDIAAASKLDSASFWE
ncbi:UNVERIFIED_CONTAM: putative 6-phosphogluconolactonase 2 [Sesamum indicum]